MKTLFIDNNLFKLVIARIFFRRTKNIYLGKFSPIKVSETDTPEISCDEGVLLKSILCGICGTDVAKFSCNDSSNLAASALRRKGEQYLGHEVVAKVVEAPKNSKFRTNDRVVLAEMNNCKAFNIIPECNFCLTGTPILCANKHLRKNSGKVYGGFSEIFIRSEDQLLPIPDSITDESAALIEPAAVALHSLVKSKVMSGDRVLIYGAGVIALILVKLLKLYFSNSVEIHVLGKHQFQLDEAINAGASKVYSMENLDDVASNLGTFVVWANSVSKENDQISSYLNQGYSKVYDFVGSDSSLRYSLSVIESNGTIVAIGSNQAVLKLDISFLISREIKIYGIHGYAYEMIFDDYQHSMMSIIELMDKGNLDLSSYLTHQYSIDSYKTAINKATSHYGDADKVSDPVFRVGIRFN